ncbi:MAG: hypothetical protein K0S78_2907, partial [Thermomicrobiales bacterium]|nr:hypothetical protein [Thermomicrobiales bacterium]
IANGNDSIPYVLHHAGLKQILKERVVDNCAPCLNLDDRAILGTMCVCFK